MARVTAATVVLDGGRVVPAGTPEDDELAELITNEAAWSGERDAPAEAPAEKPAAKRTRQTKAQKEAAAKAAADAEAAAKAAADAEQGQGEGGDKPSEPSGADS